MSREKHHERRDYSHEVRKHRLVWVRYAYAAMGTLSLVLGIIGIFMPILPTTPFLLLSTACYARSSRRFYNWLMNHPAFGPLIIEWRTYRSIPWRVKMVAVATMTLTLGMERAEPSRGVRRQTSRRLGCAGGPAVVRFPLSTHAVRTEFRAWVNIGG